MFSWLLPKSPCDAVATPGAACPSSSHPPTPFLSLRVHRPGVSLLPGSPRSGQAGGGAPAGCRRLRGAGPEGPDLWEGGSSGKGLGVGWGRKGLCFLQNPGCAPFFEARALHLPGDLPGQLIAPEAGTLSKHTAAGPGLSPLSMTWALAPVHTQQSGASPKHQLAPCGPQAQASPKPASQLQPQGLPSGFGPWLSDSSCSRCCTTVPSPFRAGSWCLCPSSRVLPLVP